MSGGPSHGHDIVATNGVIVATKEYPYIGDVASGSVAGLVSTIGRTGVSSLGCTVDKAGCALTTKTVVARPSARGTGRVPVLNTETSAVPCAPGGPVVGAVLAAVLTHTIETLLIR